MARTPQPLSQVRDPRVANATAASTIGGPHGPAAVYVPDESELPSVAEVGGKGYNLARLTRMSRDTDPPFRVPRFVVIGASAFDECLRSVQTSASPLRDVAAWKEAVRRAPISVQFARDLASALERSGLIADGGREGGLAVRSSASVEDGSLRSFAGQFDSVLGVRVTSDLANVLDAVKEVWASAFNARAQAYQEDAPASPAGRDSAPVSVQDSLGDGSASDQPLSHGIRMAVVIQEMTEPAVSGVVFSRDPISGDESMAVVSAVYGLGEGLVSGELDADSYHVAFGQGRQVVETRVAHKDRRVRAHPDGRTQIDDVPAAQRDLAALGDDEALRVAHCARAIADRFGAPQDIEWALVDRPGKERELVVLQARPITPARQSAEGERCLWDNSNIIESYSGVTTPLTFTFARAAYEDVYRQFFRLMGVREPVLEAQRDTLANMLGLVRGRVYYNLLNWYRALALLPGFAFNRGFMERMMGVRERLESLPTAPTGGSRLVDLLRLIGVLVQMMRQARRLPVEVPAFHARVARTLAPLDVRRMETMPAREALALYRRLEDELLRHWRAPLVNDFFAMMHFGLLSKLTEQWLVGTPPTLVNDLLCGEGGIISTQPARRVMELASAVRANAALLSLFAEEDDDRRLWERIEGDPAHTEFFGRLTAYVREFGDRTMEELKLETITLTEDPSFLVHMIRSYLATNAIDADGAWRREREIRSAAESVARGRLGPVRRWVYWWNLRRARARVRDRENLRFERTRVFAVARRIFLALGRELASANALDAQRDVFYLTREELFAHFAGTGVTLDLRRLAAMRREEFDRFAREAPPPDRFETVGPPAAWTSSVSTAGLATSGSGDREALPRSPVGGEELRGTGCCPGVVRAHVRVVRDPRQARELSGRILVAERTDPGWTLLFRAVRGLLVQRGSLLSHSAIVAREMGVPCIVGIPRLLDALHDDDLVEMDGATGIVRRMPSDG